MFVQGVDNMYDIVWARGEDGVTFTYGDVYLENEREYSAYNFEVADTDFLFQEFADREIECLRTLRAGLPLPAYDSVLKCCHAFNLLDARGVISATERMAYILRVRTLAKACCASYMKNVVGVEVAEADLEAVLAAGLPEEPAEEPEKAPNVVPAVQTPAQSPCASAKAADQTERAFEFVTLPDATDEEA